MKRRRINPPTDVPARRTRASVITADAACVMADEYAPREHLLRQISTTVEENDRMRGELRRLAKKITSIEAAVRRAEEQIDAFSPTVVVRDPDLEQKLQEMTARNACLEQQLRTGKIEHPHVSEQTFDAARAGVWTARTRVWLCAAMHRIQRENADGGCGETAVALSSRFLSEFEKYLREEPRTCAITHETITSLSKCVVCALCLGTFQFDALRRHFHGNEDACCPCCRSSIISVRGMDVLPVMAGRTLWPSFYAKWAAPVTAPTLMDWEVPLPVRDLCAAAAETRRSSAQ